MVLGMWGWKPLRLGVEKKPGSVIVEGCMLSVAFWLLFLLSFTVNCRLCLTKDSLCTRTKARFLVSASCQSLFIVGYSWSMSDEDTLHSQMSISLVLYSGVHWTVSDEDTLHSEMPVSVS